jgi:hypothetical protein
MRYLNTRKPLMLLSLLIVMLVVSACTTRSKLQKVEWFPCKLKETVINSDKTTEPRPTTWDYPDKVLDRPKSTKCYIDIDTNNFNSPPEVLGIRVPIVIYHF